MYNNDYYDFTTGTFFTNPAYKEILKLDTMLTEAYIPHELTRLMDGWQVWYPSKDDCVMDAIEHCGSYGHESDKLEIMGLLTPEEEACDSVLGYLTAEEVLERIRKHYVKNLSIIISSSHESDIAIIEGDPIKHIMTPEEFKQAMADAYHQHYENNDDVEVVHLIMDDIMCDLLRDLGYGEGIDIFKETPKWYA